MRRVTLTVLLFGAAMYAAGCAGLVDVDGKPVSLREYDSVVVESVTVAEGVEKKQMGELLKGYLQADLLVSETWKRGGDFDLEATADFVERYATTPGTINGKPLKPAVDDEEFEDRYAKNDEDLRALMARPKGSRPILLRVEIINVRFPGTIDEVITGRKSEATCRVTVFDPGATAPRGTAEVTGRHALPGIPILPVSVVIRTVGKMAFGEYTRKHVLDLVANTSREIVKVLTEAKQR